MPAIRHLAHVAILVVWAALTLGAGPALAHPHVLVDARAELVFDEGGRVAAVRNIWQFDEAFTAFALQGLDADGDGKIGPNELEPLARLNVESLAEYRFFTRLFVHGGRGFAFAQPTEYWLDLHGGRLTLFYTLPLKTPVAADKPLMLEIFDPEYFVAFTFVADEPVRLVGAPAGCAAAYRKPKDLDAATLARLAAIPAEERDLPPELSAAAGGLAHRAVVECR